MSICTFKHPNPSKSKKTFKGEINVVFFKMETAYKDSSIYMIGLKNLQEVVLKTMKGYKLRIYCDIHRYEEIKQEKWASNSNIELIIFDCPNYKENGYHIGTFGTFMRFFPMY